jgi:protocatechuate 3,4-dioxygenase beta subunit
MHAVVFIALVGLLGLNALPASAQETRLVITVVDEFDQPFPDVRVDVRVEVPAPRGTEARAIVEPPTRLFATTNTDALGTAVFRLQPFRSYRIRVVREGFRTSEITDRQIWATPGEAVARPYKLISWFGMPVDSNSNASPPPPRGVLSGRVLSTTGDAVGDVVVEIKPDGSGLGAPDARTAADGSYRVALAPGTYMVSMRANFVAPLALRSRPTVVVFDGASQPVHAVVSSRKETVAPDVVVRPIQLFNTRLNVLDDEGKPLPGARVRYSAVRKAQAFSLSGELSTSANGSVMLGPLLPGDVHVFASGSRGTTHLAVSTTIEIVDRPQRLTLRLLPAASMTGRVEFIGRDAPLTGGGLRIYDVGLDGIPGGHRQDDRTGLVGPDGEFTLMDLAGERCLKIDSVPYGWRLVDITLNQEDYTSRPFRLDSGDEISGVLVRLEEGTTESRSWRCSR